ncbi:MAG: transposase [Candidatus Brocadia sp.]|jgi:hypothetical protein
MCEIKDVRVNANEGAKEEIERVVNHVWNRWPEVKIVVRGDSRFARKEIMSWCEGNHADYPFRLARNT